MRRNFRRGSFVQTRRIYFVISFVAFVAVFYALAAFEGQASDHGGGHEAKPAAPTKSTGQPSLSRYSAIARLWENFREKIRRTAELDQDNELLRRHVAELELAAQQLRVEADSCREASRAEQIKEDSKAEGGLEVSRTVASLKPADPGLLGRSPRVIFEEASEAFAEEDYETAGRAFVFLVDNPDNEAFRDAQTFYLTGVSLYKVGNYKRAISYLTQARALAEQAPAKSKPPSDELSYGPRALGWIALAYKRLGDEASERKTIRELIQKYPKSKEARRLNRNA